MPKIQVFVKTEALQEIQAMVESDKAQGASSRDANISSKSAMLLELGLRVYRLRTQESDGVFDQMVFNEILLTNVIETRFLAESLVEGVFEGVVDADPNSKKDNIVKRSKLKALDLSEKLFPKGE